MSYIGSKRSSSLVSATEITLDGAKLKSSGDSITKSDGTTAVLSESSGTVTVTTNNAIIEGSSSGDLVRITQTGSGNALVVEDSANPDSTPFVVNASGSVGIGTSPSTILHVRGTDTNPVALRMENTTTTTGKTWQIGSTNAGLLQLATIPGVADYLTVNSSGNVKIGTGSASAKLDVNGIFKCVGAQPTSLGGTAGIFDGANYYALWCDGSASLNANSRCLGNFAITGALSKGSGSFKIDHPLPELNETHHLVHSFIEGPQADNIYRGKVELVNGRAEVNIDINSGMTESTFVALNREVQCFTSNETGWTAVKGFVSGNILTITAQDETCTDTISWLVIGERQDQHMYDTDWTDENGKVIVEPEKTLED